MFGLKRKGSGTGRWIWFQESLVLGVCFFYSLIYVHPLLITEALPPVFITGGNYFSGYTGIPGGMTDWLSALIMQFWISDFLVSIFLTFIFWVVTFLTRKWMETQTESRPLHTFHLIPACLLLILHSQYYFPLGITLALIINLTAVNLFIRWGPDRWASRAALGIVVSLMLFWITGGGFAVFAVLCGVNDLFRRQIVNGLVQLVVLAVVPYVSTALVFLVPVREAYLHNLVFEIITNLRINAYILPGFYLTAVIIISVARITVVRKLAGRAGELARFGKLAHIWKYAIGTLLLLGAAFLLRQVSYNENTRLVLEINKSVRDGRWQDALKDVMQCTIVNPLLLSQTNFALFHTGSFLERMFAYPQFYGTAGLLMNFEWRTAWPEKVSDIYWKLGLVNESLHWAHEAFELKGPTPEILKRLGTAYMVKDENRAAERFFLNLKSIPFQEKTAGDLLQLNENPIQAARDSAIINIRSLMPVENLISIGKALPEELEMLLNRNPKNKMAFEYLMAYYLMDGKLAEIMKHLAEFKDFAYPRFPRHIQEALLIVASMDKNFDQNQLKNIVQQSTFNRYIMYQRILFQYRTNRDRAREELQKQLGDTYWYYLMFVNPASRQTEEHNEFQ